MKHAREDYNRIQDPENKIPADEPVFLLRGQDPASPHAIRAWANYARTIGASKKIVNAALDQAIKMELWQQETKIKTPDL